MCVACSPAAVRVWQLACTARDLETSPLGAPALLREDVQGGGSDVEPLLHSRPAPLTCFNCACFAREAARRTGTPPPRGTSPVQVADGGTVGSK